MDPRERDAREAIEQRKRELLDRAYDRVVQSQLNKISSQKTYTQDDEEAYRQQNASDREKAVNKKRKALTAEHEELARTTGLSGHVVALMASGGQEDSDNNSSGSGREKKHRKKKSKKKYHKKEFKKRMKDRRKARSESQSSISSNCSDDYQLRGGKNDVRKKHCSDDEVGDRKKNKRSKHHDSDSSSEYRREKRKSKTKKSLDSKQSD